MLSSSLPVVSLSGRTVPHHLFGLALTGVYQAIRVTTNAVSSYLTFSPLPLRGLAPKGGLFSVVLAVAVCGLCRHKPYCAQVLPGSVSNEPGLSSATLLAATIRLAISPNVTF